jgi:hypothetical protein
MKVISTFYLGGLKMKKSEKLKKAIVDFKQSKQSAEDYLSLFVVVRTCMSPADGLTWDRVEEIVGDALE